MTGPAARACAAVLGAWMTIPAATSTRAEYSGFSSGLARILDLKMGGPGFLKSGRTPDGQSCGAYIWSNGGETTVVSVESWDGTYRGKDGRTYRKYVAAESLTTSSSDDPRSLTYVGNEIEITAARGLMSRSIAKIEFAGASDLSITTLRSIFVGERSYGFWESGLTCEFGENR